MQIYPEEPMKALKKILFLSALTAFSIPTMAVNLPGPLVGTAWLKSNLDKVVILDVRNNIKSFTALPRFIKDKNSGQLILVDTGGHIPNARFIDYSKLRSKRVIGDMTIDHMLPDKATFERLIQSAGVNGNDTLIIMSEGEDNGDMTSATRLYWSLKYFGQDHMAILDGGMTQWLKDGGEATNQITKNSAGNWVATAERSSILATSEDVKKAIKEKNAQLIDTRPVSQYLGTYKKPYVYAKGHIPGAVNLPNELITGPNGNATFTSANEIKEISKLLNIDTGKEIITYCNSGHLATGSWFMYSEVLGKKNVKMYDGSMHEWTSEKGETVSLESK